MDLEAAANQKGAILVSSRILRRVIKRDRRVARIGLDVPHAFAYVVSRRALLAIADPVELGRGADALPDPVVLLPRQDPDGLADRGRAMLLWRGLFHASVHRAMDERLGAGGLSVAAVRARVHQIGQTEFDEIRFVLREDQRLFYPDDDRETYAEFAATYLELASFAPDYLGRTFPALAELGDIDATLAMDVDVRTLLERSRPDLDLPSIDALLRARRRETPSTKPAPGPTREEPGDDALLARLRPLAAKLARALAAPDDRAPEWALALLPLARAASRTSARWSRPVRALYDLERACIDHERVTEVVDLVTWARTLGRRPLRRALPAQREVRVLKRVRAAQSKLPPGTDLARLGSEWVELAESNLRAAMLPRLRAALEETGFATTSLPERVALRQVTGTIVDQIAERGFLSLGHVRDALSKSDLKMENLAGVLELWRGDALLALDRRLALSLDGVYRPGEAYLRFLQRVSSIFFGTRVGRAATLYAILPVGAAFVGLSGLQHVVGPICELVLHVREPHLLTRRSWAVVTFVVFALLHGPRVRAAALEALRRAAKVFHAAFVDLPLAVWRSPVVSALRHSRPFAMTYRYALKPAILGGLVTGALVVLRVPRTIAAWTFGAACVLSSLLLNTRVGYNLEEALLDWLATELGALGSRVLPGLWSLIVSLFRQLVDELEGALYAVDEYLRFHAGDHPLSVVAKAVLGIVWFFATYLIRIYANLLIEPTVNPIKHFPVVTVAAKIMLPIDVHLVPRTARAFSRVMGRTVGRPFGAISVFLIPGFFGFLVWELKENYKLYRMNRAAFLAPSPIGHHGETMAALLKPGFHSGTLPKTYAKLRRSAYKGRASQRRHARALEAVEHAVVRFVDRELVATLHETGSWRRGDLEVLGVSIASNRLSVDVACPGAGGAPVRIAFEEQSGWLLGCVARAGFLDALDDSERTTFETALAGLYARAGVDLVRERIAATLPTRATPYDVATGGLVVWPGPGYEKEIVIDLAKRKDLFFSSTPIAWTTWVSAWPSSDGAPPARIVEGPSLLPPRPEGQLERQVLPTPESTLLRPAPPLRSD